MPTKIYTENTVIKTTEILAGGGTVILEHDALLLGPGGLDLGAATWTVDVEGTIRGFGGGLFLEANTGAAIGKSKITVGEDGSIESTNPSGGAAITLHMAADITNKGLIQGGDIGIFADTFGPTTAKGFTVTNNATGRIIGDTAIVNNNAGQALTITNKGHIEGATAAVTWAGLFTLNNTGSIDGDLTANSNAVATITNGGSIDGNIDTGNGNDVLKNTGDITGNIHLFDGKNNVTNSGEIVAPLVQFGTGDDTMVNSGSITGTVNFGSGHDKLTNTGELQVVTAGGDSMVLTNTGEITGSVFLTSKTTTLTNGGEIFNATINGETLSVVNTGTIDHSVSFGVTGTSKLTNSGLIGDNVTFSSGDDTVTNSGHIAGDLSLSDGANKLTNSGLIDGDVFGGTGNDVIGNTKTIAGDVSLGIGINKMTNGGTIGGDVLVDVGNDTIINTKSIGGEVALGDGDNTLTNSGSIGGDVVGGGGNDVITSTKLIGGAVDLGDGTNSLTNSGTIMGGVLTGSDHDVFKNTGIVNGVIDLGSGDDTFTGGNGAEILKDAAGNDTYSFGGGNDQLFLTSGTDSADGGTGVDEVLADNVGTATRINLDTKIVTINGQDLAANSAVGTGVAATVKNFENINGSGSDDILAGNAGANEISGSGGNDFIYGGLGVDTLSGGAGDDTFVFLTTKDSGLVRGARDTILDFQNAGATGGDKIDLSKIDAITTIDTDQGFLFIGTNVAFSAAGQLRAIIQDGNTILEGDVNGDLKADFSITVVGTQTFIGDDFVL